MIKKFIQITVIIFIIFTRTLYPGITGKIAGRVTDAETRMPLPGVNIVLSGTTLGAATDHDGYYTILNIPPGIYTLSVTMMGYKEIRMEGLRVYTDFTTTQGFQLSSRILEMEEEVVVIGKKPDIQRDRTSTLAVIGSDEIEKLPVREISEIIDLQAGVVEGHFRGGRLGEVSYMVDGISVSDPYDGQMAIQVENSTIQEIKVISGTFSAEYGQALSGVVNIITKTGAKDFKLYTDFYSGDYYSKNDPPFLNITNINPMNILCGEFNITGPVPVLNNSSFFLAGRHVFSGGYINGIEEYLPQDSSNTDDPDPGNWYIEHSGSSDFVLMNPSQKSTLQGKLSTKITPRITIDLQGNYFTSQRKNYNHLFKYNPKGIPTNYQDGYQFAVSLTHSPSQKYFYTIKGTQYYTNHKSYVFEDPNSSGYVSPQLLRRLGYGFFNGGMDMNHFYRNSRINAVKFNLIAQPNRMHELKTGFEYRQSNLWLHEFSLRLDRATDWKPERYPGESVLNNRYRHIPKEISCWFEDKVELQRIILSLGLRFDYFDPDGVIPKDLRDPNGSYYNNTNPNKKVPAKTQWSPRLGISYPITDQGAIHISYGHFFQIPNFEYLYHNSEFEVAPGGLYTIIGNASLEPKKTVIYQLGLQQMLLSGLILDLTGYYKDIRNLVGTEIYELYILGDSYARYENRDYGNVRGIAISLTQKPISWFSGSVDYTYQISEGNASDPRAVFYDRQSDPPRSSEIQVVPLDWDQTHTLNITLSIVQKSWGIGLIGKYGSGLPYTPEYQNQRTAFENSERKPETINFDLNLHRDINIGKIKVVFYTQIKNLFDRKNSTQVFNDTGSPAYSLIPIYVPEQPIHTLKDFLTRPDFYAAPRQIIIGFKLTL